MTIDLYYHILSAPCRTVMLTAKAVGVDLNLIFTDLFKSAHLTPEFIKLNPQHAVPVLNDNGFVLSESRAISSYLVEKYAKDDSLYPKDPNKRAVVNQRLYFNIGTLYPSITDYYGPIIYRGKDLASADLSKIEEAFGFFDKFLEDQMWAAGDNLTIADIDFVTTVSTAETFDIDIKKYPNVYKWYTNAKKSIPGYEEINAVGCTDYRKLWDQAISRK